MKIKRGILTIAAFICLCSSAHAYFNFFDYYYNVTQGNMDDYAAWMGNDQLARNLKFVEFVLKSNPMVNSGTGPTPPSNWNPQPGLYDIRHPGDPSWQIYCPPGLYATPSAADPSGYQCMAGIGPIQTWGHDPNIPSTNFDKCVKDYMGNNTTKAANIPGFDSSRAMFGPSYSCYQDCKVAGQNVGQWTKKTRPWSASVYNVWYYKSSDECLYNPSYPGGVAAAQYTTVYPNCIGAISETANTNVEAWCLTCPSGASGALVLDHLGRPTIQIAACDSAVSPWVVPLNSITSCDTAGYATKTWTERLAQFACSGSSPNLCDCIIPALILDCKNNPSSCIVTQPPLPGGGNATCIGDTCYLPAELVPTAEMGGTGGLGTGTGTGTGGTGTGTGTGGTGTGVDPSHWSGSFEEGTKPDDVATAFSQTEWQDRWDQFSDAVYNCGLGALFDSIVMPEDLTAESTFTIPLHFIGPDKEIQIDLADESLGQVFTIIRTVMIILSTMMAVFILSLKAR